MSDPRYALVPTRLSGGIFNSNLFRSRGVGGLGAMPEGAIEVASIETYRRQFPTLPSAADLRRKGATHFLMRTPKGGGAARDFTFFAEDGEIVVGPTTFTPGGSGPVQPAPDKGSPLPARSEGDGLLPGSSAAPAPAPEPKWLPWLLLGGGVVVAGGIVWAATRKRRPVKTNRRKQRRRRRTSR